MPLVLVVVALNIKSVVVAKFLPYRLIGACAYRVCPLNFHVFIKTTSIFTSYFNIFNRMILK